MNKTQQSRDTMNKVMKFFKDEDGASPVEYALLVGLTALAITIGAGLLGGSLNTYFGALSVRIYNLSR